MRLLGDAATLALVGHTLAAGVPDAGRVEAEAYARGREEGYAQGNADGRREVTERVRAVLRKRK